MPLRPRFLAIALACSIAASIGSTSTSARAQAPAPEAEKPKPVPPKVKKKVEPVYPPERLKAGERATVKVELTIDATGVVTNATISEGAGDDFDAAALEAAKQLEFEPATLAGKPIPSKIIYRFSFDFTELPKPVSEQPKIAEGELAGVVRTPTEEPLPGATVTLLFAGATKATATTDANGKFVFGKLPPGKYRVRVETQGFEPFESDEEIVAGKSVQPIYRPKLAGGALAIEVKGERPPREVTVHTLDQRELTRIPGTNGDALRAVQSLPGVARPPGLAGFLIIRGSLPTETNIFVDGVLIPIAYHFGGLSSVVPTEMIDRLDFYPGNFSPDYGRVSGGVIDIASRSPKKDRLHGLVQFDLIDGRVLVESPIDDKTRVVVAGRRSWVDAWLGPVLRSAGAGVSTAPVYYDYQLMIERDITASTRARLFFFGSNDRLAITVNTPASSDPIVGGDITTTTGFWRLVGRVETQVTDAAKWTNTVSYGEDFVDFSIGDNFFRLDSYPTAWRSDLRAKLSKEATLIAGMDWFWDRFDVSVRFPPPPQPGEASGPFFARPVHQLSGTGALYRPGLYTMLDLSPIKGLKLLPGVRLDYTKDAAQWTVSPRFAVRYDVVQGIPRTTLKAGVGIYHQAPQPQQAIPPFGTPGIKNERTTHYAIGFEQQFDKETELKVEGFYKDLTRLIGADLTETSNAAGITYANRGDGHVIGLESLLKYSSKRAFGWLAYTLSRAVRRTDPTQEMTVFAWDQTHILTVLGSVGFGSERKRQGSTNSTGYLWELGARWRYVTGRPFTPNVGGVVDFDAGAYAPIPQIPLYNSRIEPFHQLDIRLDKAWEFDSWTLSAYLDVQNVYYRKNPEGVTYNYNYTQRDVVSGLPILPIIGLRGEL
ncbi:MAG: TonB family protein [Polyangiales bacterium]